MRDRLARTAIIAWLVALGATAAAIAGWTRPVGMPPRDDGGRATTGASPIDAGTVDAGAPIGLDALRACTEELARRDLAPLPAGASAEPDERIARCLSDPAVRERFERQVTEACAMSADAAHELARQSEEQARARAAAAFLRDELAITEPEQAQLTQYLCAVRDLRGRLARAAADGGVPGTYDQVRAERELVVGDVERLLGEERYRRLRAVGGLGILSDGADCAR